MPKSSGVSQQFAKRLQKIEREIKGASRAAVDAAAFEMKKAVDAEIVRVAPSRRLRGVGRRGARIGVRYDLKGTKNPTAVVRAFGPLHLIERKTGGHMIAPRRRGRGLVLKDGQVRRAVHHPGTRGRFPFKKGVERGQPHALKKLIKAHEDALKRGFS